MPPLFSEIGEGCTLQGSQGVLIVSLQNKLKWLPTTFIAAALYLFLSAHPAIAVMASPENIFRQANPSELLLVKEVNKLKHLNHTHSHKVSVSNFALEDDHYIFVRFCDSGTQDYCPTAFFMTSISDETFYGIGLFPPEASLGDVIYRNCESCGNITPLVFFGPDDSSKSIGLSAQGIFF